MSKTVPMTFGLVSEKKMNTYKVIVNASNFYKGPRTYEVKALNIDNLRKNLLKEWTDTGAFSVKIEVYKKEFIGVLTIYANQIPIWKPFGKDTSYVYPKTGRLM